MLKFKVTFEKRKPVEERVLKCILLVKLMFSVMKSWEILLLLIISYHKTKSTSANVLQSALFTFYIDEIAWSVI